MVPCSPMVRQIIQKLCVCIELVHEATQPKISGLSEGDQWIELGFQGRLQEDHARIGNGDAQLDDEMFHARGKSVKLLEHFGILTRAANLIFFAFRSSIVPPVSSREGKELESSSPTIQHQNPLLWPGSGQCAVTREWNERARIRADDHGFEEMLVRSVADTVHLGCSDVGLDLKHSTGLRQTHD